EHSTLVQRDQLGDKLTRLSIALNDHRDIDSAGQQCADVERSFRPELGGSDECTKAAQSQRLGHLREDRRDTGGIECVADAASSSELTDGFDWVGFFGVDDVGCPELLGEFEA